MRQFRIRARSLTAPTDRRTATPTAAFLAALSIALFITSAIQAAPPDPEWTRLGIGPDRALHAMVFDPVNDFYWVFGGLEADVEGSEFHNTIYERSATDDEGPWFVLPIPGLRPPDLAFHTAVYDPKRMRMVVAGGLLDRRGFGFQQPIDGNSIWWLDLATRESVRWSNRVVPGNGTPRFGHAAVYVPDFDAMIISGGFSSFTDARSDHFALLMGEDPMRWVRLPNRGFSPRGGHALIWDGARKRLLSYGGATNLETISTRAELLELDLSGGLESAEEWRRVTPASPSRERAFAAHGFDPESSLWWVHGGVIDGTGFVRNVDVLDLSVDPPEWTRTGVTLDGPLDRFGHAFAWDPGRRRLVVQGGTPDNARTLRDTRALVIPDDLPIPTTSPTPSPTLSATDVPPPIDTPVPSPTAGGGPDPSPTPTAEFELHLPWASNPD